MPEACPVYRPRKPHLTPHYQCVQDHFETLEQVWPERFEKYFGFWRYKHAGLCPPVRARMQRGFAERRPKPEAHSPPRALR